MRAPAGPFCKAGARLLRPPGRFCKTGVRFFCARPTGRFCKTGARFLRPAGRFCKAGVRFFAHARRVVLRSRGAPFAPAGPPLFPVCPPSARVHPPPAAARTSFPLSTPAHARFPLVKAPFPRPLHALPSTRARSPLRPAPSAHARSPFRFFGFPVRPRHHPLFHPRRPAAFPYRAPGRCSRLPLRRRSFPVPFYDSARLL